MDQAQLSTMDPKLREAYEKIMGTPSQPVTQTATTQPIPASPISTQLNTNPVNGSNTVSPNLSLNSQPNIQNRPPIIPSSQNTSENPSVNNTASNTSLPPTQPMNQNSSGPITSNTSHATPFMDPILADNQMHAYVAQEVAGVKQSLKLIQLMYISGGLVFFAVYALFWMKFFNVLSPF